MPSEECDEVDDTYPKFVVCVHEEVASLGSKATKGDTTYDYVEVEHIGNELANLVRKLQQFEKELVKRGSASVHEIAGPLLPGNAVKPVMRGTKARSADRQIALSIYRTGQRGPKHAYSACATTTRNRTYQSPSTTLLNRRMSTSLHRKGAYLGWQRSRCRWHGSDVRQLRP